MKTFAAILLFLVLAGTAARASSFVEPEEMDNPLGPSMVALGEPAQATAEAEAESPSIVALGSESAPEPVIASAPVRRPPHDTAPADAAPADSAGLTLVSVSPSIVASQAAVSGIDEAKTAAIGDDGAAPKRGPHFEPMVIRGGIKGDAFARSVPREAFSDAQTGAQPNSARAQRSGDDAPGQAPNEEDKPAPAALRPELGKPM